MIYYVVKHVEVSAASVHGDHLNSNFLDKLVKTGRIESFEIEVMSLENSLIHGWFRKELISVLAK